MVRRLEHYVMRASATHTPKPPHEFDHVRVRALRDFRWRPAERGRFRRVARGDVLEVAPPRASSLVAIGRAEFAN
jgi:hypothetical protein